MIRFGKIKRIIFDESSSVLPPPPTTFPFTSPFDVTLPNGGAVNLAVLNIDAHPQHGVLLNAVVNWSATFTPPATPSVLNLTGFADVTFELLLNGSVIYRVSQSAVQKAIPLSQPTFLFAIASTTYEIASLLHFDTTPADFNIGCKLGSNIGCNIGCNCSGINTYTLRATNIFLVPPQVSTGIATTSAVVGAVTLVAEKVNACKKVCF